MVDKQKKVQNIVQNMFYHLDTKNLAFKLLKFRLFKDNCTFFNSFFLADFSNFSNFNYIYYINFN